jgi:ATP-dependent DNA helicase HFM1/MER3
VSSRCNDGPQLRDSLHLNLLEHIVSETALLIIANGQNAEIVLGTITHLETAMQWLRGTFFFVRYQKNPQHYKLPGVDEHSYGVGFLESLCSHHVSLLQDYELVSPSTALHSTRYGESAAKFSVRIETARRFLNLPSQAKLSEMASLTLASG